MQQLITAILDGNDNTPDAVAKKINLFCFQLGYICSFDKLETNKVLFCLSYFFFLFSF